MDMSAGFDLRKPFLVATGRSGIVIAHSLSNWDWVSDWFFCLLDHACWLSYASSFSSVPTRGLMSCEKRRQFFLSAKSSLFTMRSGGMTLLSMPLRRLCTIIYYLDSQICGQFVVKEGHIYMVTSLCVHKVWRMTAWKRGKIRRYFTFDHKLCGQPYIYSLMLRKCAYVMLLYLKTLYQLQASYVVVLITDAQSS